LLHCQFFAFLIFVECIFFHSFILKQQKICPIGNIALFAGTWLFRAAGGKIDFQQEGFVILAAIQYTF
jgi:hypothetical protein